MQGVFECIDGHTCGNPVRVVASGGPELKGADMSEKRLHGGGNAFSGKGEVFNPNMTLASLGIFDDLRGMNLMA